MSPHSAIIEINWEVHEKKSDGSYYGAATDKGKTMFVLHGEDRVLANEYINALIDLIKRKGTNVSELELNEERLKQARISGSSGPRDNNIKMFGMRGIIGRNSIG